MRESNSGNPIQVFTPDPVNTTTLTLTGGTATWTPAKTIKTYMFYPTAQVVQKLNANTTGLTFDSGVKAGPFGRHSNTTSITFTGTADSTIVIEAN